MEPLPLGWMLIAAGGLTAVVWVTLDIIDAVKARRSDRDRLLADVERLAKRARR